MKRAFTGNPPRLGSGRNEDEPSPVCAGATAAIEWCGWRRHWTLLRAGCSTVWPLASRYASSSATIHNWPNHTHPEVRRGVERLPQLELVFLPTYAPYLNPEEKVWRWTKQHLVHAHPYGDDFHEFKRQIVATLEEAKQQSKDLLRYCGLQVNN